MIADILISGYRITLCIALWLLVPFTLITQLYHMLVYMVANMWGMALLSLTFVLALLLIIKYWFPSGDDDVDY